MIGKARTGTTFGGLSGYLLHGRTPEVTAERGLQDYLLDGREEERGRVAWTEVRNLPTEDPELAARMMQATAEQNVRVQKPVYHLSLSASPGEHLTRERWGQVIDRVLGDLDLKEHQVLVVAHNDTRHPHVHLMVNRVHPDYHKAWSTSHDYRRIERSLRHIERDFRLREVPGRHYQLPAQERPEREGKLTSGERQQQERTGEQSWTEQVRFRTYNDFKQAENWGDLERRLARHKLRLERRGGGLVVTDGRQRVKASRIYRRGSYKWLEKRFGMSFDDWRRGRRELVEMVDRYQKTERQRSRLRRQEERAWRELGNARERIAQLDDVRSISRRTAKLINATLDDLYRGDQVPQVRRRLAAEARQVGWEEAARRLAADPRRFGKLRRRPRDRDERGHVPRPRRRGLLPGRSLAPRRIPTRRLRRMLLGRVVSAAADLGALRSARLVAGPAGYKAISAALLAGRTWQRARNRRENLPPSKTQLAEIAGRAAALGWSAVSLTLSPRPLQVVRVAIRTVQLARSMTRGRGR